MKTRQLKKVSNKKLIIKALNKSDTSSKKTIQKTRAHILSVALTLFSRRGFEGVTVRQIAQATGVNLSLVSYYFGGKEGLYKAVMAGYFDKAQELFTQSVETFNPQGTEKQEYIQFWKHFLLQIIQFKQANHNIEELLILEFLKGLPYSYDIHRKSFPKMVKALNQIIDYGKKHNWLRDDVNYFVWISMMVSGIDMFLVLSRTHCPFKKESLKMVTNQDEWVDQIIKIYFQGVAL